MFFLLVFFAISTVLCEEERHENDRLKLVFCMARHGERTPDGPPTYPKDIYVNTTYNPYGPGQITLLGRERQYLLGESLRKRYATLFNDTYEYGTVKARSTNFGRTKESLLAMLAGLVPPGKQNIWSSDITLAKSWFPIAIDSKPLNADPELLGITCPNYLKLYEAYTKTDEYKQMNKTFEKLLTYVQNATGYENVSVLTIRFRLFFTLTSQEQLGLVLPDWTKTVYPDQLAKAVLEAYKAYVPTTQMKKYASGFFLKEILTEIQKKINGTLEPQRRMYLYNCHEYNVGTMLYTLGISQNEIPECGSHILFELHKKSDGHYIKILQHNYKQADPIATTVPGCEGTLCKLETFSKIVEKYLPTESDVC